MSTDLIVTAFRAWQERHLWPGTIVDSYHVEDFYRSLANVGETLPKGSWSVVFGALHEAGIVPAMTRHIWIGTKRT